MATNINTILNWFRTSLKPTQAQFWAALTSFWHKDEAIPQSSINGLTNVLNAKMETEQFEAHKVASDAHSALFLAKENKSDKGAANGYVPLNELVKISYQYLNIIDDLITGGSDNLLSAEQGLLLQNQITAINLLLSSNDIDLDTVQEIVDAIREVETSLETILVNDLTTGGATKALTAEMGKTLKTLVDGLTSNKLEKGGYAGNAQNLKNEIDDIYQPDVLIRSVPPTRVGDTFTYPSGEYEYLLSKTHHINAANFPVTIPAATDNYKRTDLIYAKPDNTLAKLGGTESLTVAIRPDVPAGCIGISFINVFGAVVSDPTSISKEISIQNGLGIEQWKAENYLRFENVSFNVAEKKIVVEGLTPLSVFIDVVSGNDSTAVLESYKKPFKTFEAMMLALPAYNEDTYTVYSFGGTIPILRRINMRNLEFVGIKATTLDFTNVKEDDGVTTPQNVLRKLHAFANTFWTFRGFNISIVSNNTGDVIFKNGNVSTDTVHVLGYINSLIWQGAPTQNVGSFNTGSLSNFIINTVYDTGASGKMLSCWGNIVINNFVSSRAVSIFYYGNTVEIKTISKANTGTTGTVQMANGSGGSAINYFKLGNIDINRKFQPYGNTIEFNNTIANATNISLGSVSFVTGRILSGTGAVDAGSYTLNVTLRNFSGKLAESVHYVNGQVTFENCFITVDNTLVSRNNGVQASVIQQCVTFKGNNTIVQTNTANDLIANINLPISIVIQGSISTNAVSFGRYASYTQNTSTFKEKLNEVVVRSKKDLVGKVLSSNTTYIIDAIITLLMGEYIEVPVGGLTMVGYGFDVSQINKNVAGQSIFKSPTTGGSGNFVTKDIQYNSGLGLVFDIEDSDGSHAIELNDVNFSGCASLGKFKGYRQFTGTTCGVYGCSNGFQLSGTWSGFKFTNSNVISFLTGGTLIRKDTDTIFSNRLYLDLNFSCQAGAKLSDFGASNFTADELFQINNTLCTYNGSKDATTNTAIVLPNITPNDPKARFTNCLGITESAVKFKDLKSPDGNVWRLAVDNAGAIATSSV